MANSIDIEIEQHYQSLQLVLSDNLSDELSAQDWEHIQTLDAEFRQTVENLIKTNQLSEHERHRLAKSVQELQELYTMLITKCDEYRSTLKKEMQTLVRGRKGARAYQVVA